MLVVRHTPKATPSSATPTSMVARFLMKLATAKRATNVPASRVANDLRAFDTGYQSLSLSTFALEHDARDVGTARACLRQPTRAFDQLGT